LGPPGQAAVSFFYYLVGGLAVVLTITVASHPSFFKKQDNLEIVAWLAAMPKASAPF
jgi:hypothetical protein